METTYNRPGKFRVSPGRRTQSQTALPGEGEAR